MAITTAQRTVLEGGVFSYTTTLQDASGTAIALTAIATATITLYDVESLDIINSRNAQDVLNTNNVTIHATSGLLTWDATGSDSAMVGARVAGALESHIALFQIVYDTDKTLNVELEILVQQSAKIT